MARSLSPRHAADMLGITTDTLRRWEREGLLHSERTPGGQRRYREDAIAVVLNADAPASHGTTLTQRAAPTGDDEDERPSLRPHVEVVAPWDRRVKEYRADLEVTKLRRERAALIRGEREERDTRQREADKRQRELQKQPDEAQQRAQGEAAESRRLDALRSYARTLTLLAPAEWQAKVVRNLLRTVNSETFPQDLDERYAKELVSARVEELLKPWRNAQEKERAKADNARKRDSLMSSGNWYAYTETRGWDPTEVRRARREVERVLCDEVKADWTNDDVRDLVDDILDEWDDE